MMKQEFHNQGYRSKHDSRLEELSRLFACQTACLAGIAFGACGRCVRARRSPTRMRSVGAGRTASGLSMHLFPPVMLRRTEGKRDVGACHVAANLFVGLISETIRKARPMTSLIKHLSAFAVATPLPIPGRTAAGPTPVAPRRDRSRRRANRKPLPQASLRPVLLRSHMQNKLCASLVCGSAGLYGLTGFADPAVRWRRLTARRPRLSSPARTSPVAASYGRRRSSSFPRSGGWTAF
jgi:hypothetical protein